MTGQTEGQERVAALQGLRQVVEGAVEDSLQERIQRAINDEAPVWEEKFDAGPGIVCSVSDASVVAARLVAPEWERLTAEVALLRERDALTRKALRIDEDGPLQFMALRVRQQRDEAVVEVSRLREELARLQDELVTQNRLYRKVGAERDEKQFEVERLRRWVDRFRERLATAVVLPQDAEARITALLERYWADVRDGKREDAGDDAESEQAHEVIKLVQSWAAAPVSESVPATPTIKGEQLARIHRYVRDLKDSVPDVTGDALRDAYNRGYAEADVATGGALGALLDVRFNEVLDSPEFRAALETPLRASAPSEASMEDAVLFAVAQDRVHRDKGDRHSLEGVAEELERLDEVGSASTPPSGGDSDTTPRVWRDRSGDDWQDLATPAAAMRLVRFHGEPYDGTPVLRSDVETFHGPLTEVTPSPSSLPQEGGTDD